MHERRKEKNRRAVWELRMALEMRIWCVRFVCVCVCVFLTNLHKEMYAFV